jgi:hypothetical protein
MKEYHNPEIGRRPEYRKAVETIRTARASAAARGVPFNEWATRYLANHKAR